MFNAAAQVAFTALRFGMVIPLLLASGLALILFFNLAISLINIVLNASVLGDLLALIQMFLPFNLNSIFWWFFTTTTAYIAYRVAVTIYLIINNGIFRGYS